MKPITMGLFIHLSINLNGVSNQSWEEAWHKSLDILNKFPLSLSRHNIEIKLGTKRHVYTKSLIVNSSEEDECWFLEGDLLSKQSGETFTLYRLLDYYNNEYRHHGCFDKSVFYSTDDYHTSTNGIQIWGNKTQGYPFHLAILAVGIMLENEFPDNCYMYGDIEKKQVEVMHNWLEMIYERPFLEPICFDANRLYEKLTATYSDKKSLIERYTTLYEGSITDKFKTLLHFEGKERTWDYYSESLNYYDSLSQWGASDILRTVIEVSENVYELIEFVEYAIKERPINKKVFEWKNVLELLCKDYIFVNPIQREKIRLLTDKSDDMNNINDVIGRVFMKMSGMPHISPLYVSEDDLLEIFALRDPKNGNVYLKIIEEYRIKLQKDLDSADELVDKIDRLSEIDSDIGLNQNLSEHIIDDYPEHEQYIIKQALQQQDRFGNYETNMPVICKSLQNLINQNQFLWKNKTVLEYQKGIYEYSFEAGFGISEDAWTAIDSLDNCEILKYLFMLSMVDNNEKTFWRWRMHIFETPETWFYLKEIG
jgi:hypothetical protein